MLPLNPELNSFPHRGTHQAPPLIVRAAVRDPKAVQSQQTPGLHLAGSGCRFPPPQLLQLRVLAAPTRPDQAGLHRPAPVSSMALVPQLITCRSFHALNQHAASMVQGALIESTGGCLNLQRLKGLGAHLTVVGCHGPFDRGHGGMQAACGAPGVLCKCCGRHHR